VLRRQRVFSDDVDQYLLKRKEHFHEYSKYLQDNDLHSKLSAEEQQKLQYIEKALESASVEIAAEAEKEANDFSSFGWVKEIGSSISKRLYGDNSKEPEAAAGKSNEGQQNEIISSESKEKVTHLKPNKQQEQLSEKKPTTDEVIIKHVDAATEQKADSLTKDQNQCGNDKVDSAVKLHQFCIQHIKQQINQRATA